MDFKSWVTLVTAESDETGDALSSLLFVLPVDCAVRKLFELLQTGEDERRLGDFNLNLLDQERRVNINRKNNIL